MAAVGLFRRNTPRSGGLSIRMSRGFLTHAMLMISQPMVLLWTGKITDKHNAFQLLYNIDIIRFWAEYTYKPIICTCLRRLEELRLRKIPAPLEETIWDSQITINEANTPWLFHRRDADEATFNDAETASTGTPLARHLSPPSSKAQRSSIDQSGSPSRKPPNKKSPNGQATKNSTPVIPASEEYNWLLDRSFGTHDHLMIRINRKGRILRPFILFDDTEWQIEITEDPNCKMILEQETLRYTPGVRTGFTCNKRSDKYLWSCRRSTLDYIYESTQFCAIIPLNKMAYCKQPIKNVEQQLFEPIEALLHVGALLASYEAVARQWCKCQRLVNGYEPGMIQCGNARCHLQWYHKECVDLDEDDEPEPWICPDCHGMSRDEREEVETLRLHTRYARNIEASDQRIQSTRALLHVWHEHRWPEPMVILEAFERVLYNLDIIENSRYRIHSKGITSSLNPPRYWVLKKDDPQVVKRAGPRKHQIVDLRDDGGSSEDLENYTPDSTNDDISDVDNMLHNFHV